MSNKVKRIAENIESVDYEMIYATTLVGSIVKTIGMLTQTSSKIIQLTFDNIKDNFENKIGFWAERTETNVKELCEYVWDIFDAPHDFDSYRDYVYLFTDNRNIYSPLVAPVIDDKILPLHKGGLYFGILNSFLEQRENAQAEKVWE